MSTIAAVIGRIFLAILFIVSGATKLMDPGPAAAMLTGVGMPSNLAVPVGIFELACGLLLAVGLMTRLVSLLLALFTLLAAVLFHNQLTDPVQSANFLKNVSIAGGMLLVFAHSQMWYGWDRIRRDRDHELANRKAEERARDAELRAARAEGKVDGAETVVAEPAPRRRWF